MHLDRLNGLDREVLYETLATCCGANKWIAEMVRSAPFTSEQVLFTASFEAWSKCGEVDWLEAFRHHPKIGDMDALRNRFTTTSHLAGAEQASVATASDEVLRSLKDLNDDYEKRFGFIFIVCATGKSAEEMLALLRNRIDNDREKELRIAAEEQHKITTLRLKKLIA